MRIVGWLAAILGVVGVVICLVIAAGVWLVKPEVQTRVDHLATVVVEGLDKATELSTEASQLAVQVGERLDRVATTARSLSANPVLDAVVDRVLSGAITNVVSGPWNRIQDRLGGFRERVVGLSNIVQTVDQALPFIELPGVVTGFVDDVDARWTELDQTVQEMETIAAEGVGTAERAARVAEVATNASERLDAVGVGRGAGTREGATPPRARRPAGQPGGAARAGGAGGGASGPTTARDGGVGGPRARAPAHGKVETAQADIAQAAQQVGNALTWIAVAVSIVAIWVGLLHLLLIAQARRWIRADD